MRTPSVTPPSRRATLILAIVLALATIGFLFIPKARAESLISYRAQVQSMVNICDGTVVGLYHLEARLNPVVYRLFYAHELIKDKADDWDSVYGRLQPGHQSEIYCLDTGLVRFPLAIEYSVRSRRGKWLAHYYENLDFVFQEYYVPNAGVIISYFGGEKRGSEE